MRGTGGFLALALAVPMATQERVFLELELSGETHYVGQTLDLRWRVGIERGFLENNLVPLVLRALDVPIQVQAPWLAELPDTILLDPQRLEGEGPHPTLVFGGRVIRTTPGEDRVVNGQPFAVFEFLTPVRRTVPGALELPAAAVRFAFATHFREDIINGRVALDRTEGMVKSASLAIRLQPLPLEGRPTTFSGAVGHFTLRAETGIQTARLGESFKLLLHLEGSGNLDSCGPPRLDGLEGFHVYGHLEDISSDRRTVTYDLEPLATDITAIPAVSWSFFDPGPPGAYRTVRTEPIPLHVRPRAAAARTQTTPRNELVHPVPGVDDLYDILPVAGRRTSGRALELPSALILFGLLGPWLLAAALWFGRTPHPTRAAASAARAFEEHMSSGEVDVAQAFTNYLGARLGLRPSRVHNAEFSQQLVAVAVPREVAARAAALLDRVMAARTGGGVSPARTEAVRAMVQDLEQAFGKGER